MWTITNIMLAFKTKIDQSIKEGTRITMEIEATTKIDKHSVVQLGLTPASKPLVEAKISVETSVKEEETKVLTLLVKIMEPTAINQDTKIKILNSFSKIKTDTTIKVTAITRELLSKTFKILTPSTNNSTTNQVNI